MKFVAQFRQFVLGHTIVLGLSLAVAVALIMTGISVWVYNTSDVSRLDISRPGYEKVRDSVMKGDETLSFGATGALNSETMKDFQQLFDEKRKSLNAVGAFDSNVLGDEQLKMTTTE